MTKGTVIVTGASKGIGLTVAHFLLENGYRVAGISRSQPRIDHPEFRAYLGDATDESFVAKTVATIDKEFGGILGLYNNIGDASLNFITTTTLASVQHLWNINFVSTFLWTREVAKRMMRHKQGCIVNTSSIAVPLHLEGEAVYASVKAAVEQWTLQSARELAPWGIRVNAIGPGPTDTRLLRSVPELKVQVLLNQTAQKTKTNPTDIGRLLLFYLENESITGQINYLGGVWK
jgi:3-oxoacyl-[acyl-carrier protein] reductase